jgi:glycosyltransferase involved in cell wall biosynthesis
MNILWQNEHYPDVVKGGGGAVNTYYIVRSMLTLGHNVLILSQGGEQESLKNEHVNGTPVLRMPKPRLPGKLWPLWPCLESYYLRRPLSDICGPFDGFVAIDAPYALTMKRLYPSRPLVYRVEATVRSHAAAVPDDPRTRGFSFNEQKLNALSKIMTYENELVEQLAWKKCDALVVKSEFMRSELLKLYNLKTDKVHVVPNGVDYARYAEAKPSAATIERLGKNGTGKVVIVYCGRLVRMKNVDFLLRGFARMRTKDRCLLVIIGDGEERINLEKEAATLEIAGDVRFIGKTDRVEEFFAAADIFVLPSTYEPFGNALVEAMAAGRPCVVLRPDGVQIRTASAEIIDDGQSGYFVKPDPSDLATRLDSLVLNPGLRRVVGKRAQLVCYERYNWGKCAGEYVRLLKEAVYPAQHEKRSDTVPALDHSKG